MVSVIMPTYNRAHFLRDSIGSVLQQSYHDLELIICDDGSTDGTSSVISAMDDPRVKYLHLPHTGLIGKVKNVGLRAAKGNYIAFIDSDDQWKQGKLAVQLELLEKNADAGFCITDISNFRNDRILQEHCYDKTGTVETKNIFSSMVHNRLMVFTPTIIFRKECLDSTGYFDENFEWCADFQFNTRLAYHFNAIVVYESYLLRRIHESNRSVLSSLENYGGHIKTFEWLFDHKMIGRKLLQEAMAHANKQMGFLWYQKRDHRRARHHFGKSITNKPVQISAYWHWLKTWLRLKATMGSIAA